MDIPDALIGRLLLVSTSAVFVLLSFWVNSYPFIDEGEFIVNFGFRYILNKVRTFLFAFIHRPIYGFTRFKKLFKLLVGTMYEMNVQ